MNTKVFLERGKERKTVVISGVSKMKAGDIVTIRGQSDPWYIKKTQPCEVIASVTLKAHPRSVKRGQ